MMITILRRKARQLLDDPVLRRWLWLRLLRRTAGEPAYVAHRPPYVRDWPASTRPQPRCGLAGTQEPLMPTASVVLPLAGQDVDLRPEDGDGFFDGAFADIETMLSAHRFAWLPLTPGVDPAWVDALWRSWMERFGQESDDWPWHPYTAAERAINILEHAQRIGRLPGSRQATLDCLAAHAPSITRQLEYFGDHHTSNHLANNGRGLYLLGLALGLDDHTRLGLDILLNEAGRIIGPSGYLREGSSHYHLLLTRGYASAWLAARAHDRPEAGQLESITAAMLSAAAVFALPGGMPLVGDISPDCPPAHLAGLLPGGAADTGWTDSLDPAARAALLALRHQPAATGGDGWLRFGCQGWDGLWHCPPQGWSHMPGHGHQDCGGFQLHWRGRPLIVDPGRGGYGDEGDAALYRGAAVHSGLMVDGADPYPPNRPYYSDDFRRRVGGPDPLLETIDGCEVRLRHHGFGRLGVGGHERHWRFSPTSVTIDDHVEGRGRHRLTRRLVTPLTVGQEDGQITLHDDAFRLRLVADAPVRVERLTRWNAYGRGEPATVLVIEDDAARLPWRGRIGLEVLP